MYKKSLNKREGLIELFKTTEVYRKIRKMLADKKLQLIFIFGITSAWFVLNQKIPDSLAFGKYTIYLGFLTLVGWIFIIPLILAAVVLGFSQISNLDLKAKQLLGRSYEGLYAFSFKALVGLILLGVSANVAYHLANFIRNMDINTIRTILLIVVFAILLYVLNKKGIKLFEGK